MGFLHVLFGDLPRVHHSLLRGGLALLANAVSLLQRLVLDVGCVLFRSMINGLGVFEEFPHIVAHARVLVLDFCFQIVVLLFEFFDPFGELLVFGLQLIDVLVCLGELVVDRIQGPLQISVCCSYLLMVFWKLATASLTC